MDEFHKQCAEGENPDTKIAHVIWLHLYTIPEKPK